MSTAHLPSELVLKLRTCLTDLMVSYPAIYFYPDEMLSNINCHDVDSDGDYILINNVGQNRIQNTLMNYSISIRLRCVNIDTISIVDFEYMCQGVEKSMRTLRQFQLTDDFFIVNTQSVNGIKTNTYENEYRCELIYIVSVDLHGIPGEEYIQ